jgi:type II secretory pathway pseudopilin PulG
MSINIKQGDTIIEVVFSIVIFCMVAVIAITLMNQGVATAQSSLEVIMARNEIDSQAEALRFIHAGFLAERELDPSKQQFVELWRKLTQSTFYGGFAINPEQLTPLSVRSCEDLYGLDGAIALNKGFVINTRLIQPSHSSLDYDNFLGGNDATYSDFMNEIIISSSAITAGNIWEPSPVQPRIIYTYRSLNDSESSEDSSLTEDNLAAHLYRRVAKVEGLWVIAVRGGRIYPNDQPEYFDFHIRTCWNAVGKIAPTTVGTIVRLYNPEVIEALPQ